jgi:uncharacterized protein (TIGR02246 family)
MTAVVCFKGGGMSSARGSRAASEDRSDEVCRLREEWVKAFNQREVERVIGFYTDDAIESPLNGAPAANGKAAIRDALKAVFAAGFQELEVPRTQVGHTDPLAVELATYTVKCPVNGGPARCETGRLVATWRRAENGEFKITISVWSRELSDADD